MSGHGLVKEWFIPGDGIDRQVISSDIQRYLGNDATVRPGIGTGQDQGVRGYWVKAYRTLTNAMVDDLRASSRRWEAERQRTGTRDAYQESQSYAVAGGGMPSRRPGDPTMGPMDPRYRDAPPDRGGRPQDRMYPDDHMAVDPSYGQVPPGRYQQQDRVERYGDDMTYGQGGRPPQHRQDARDPRGPYHDGRDYPQHGSFMPEQRFGGRMPEPDMRDGRGDYRGDPRAQPGFAGMNGPPLPPDYGRPPDMYNAGPPNLPYGSAQPMHAPPRGMEPAFPGPQFGATAGQPGPPPALGPPGPHGPPRNDRYPPQTSGFGQEMRDPRDPSTFGHGGPPQGNVNPQFDQYGGRPPMSHAFPGQPGQPGQPTQPGLIPGHMPGPLPGPAARPPQGNLGPHPPGPRPPGPSNDLGGDPRDSRRRRLQ